MGSKVASKDRQKRNVLHGWVEQEYLILSRSHRWLGIGRVPFVAALDLYSWEMGLATILCIREMAETILSPYNSIYFNSD